MDTFHDVGRPAASPDRLMGFKSFLRKSFSNPTAEAFLSSLKAHLHMLSWVHTNKGSAGGKGNSVWKTGCLASLLIQFTW